MSSFSFKQPLYELEDVIDDDVDVDEIQSQLDYHVRFFLRNRLCLYDTIYVTLTSCGYVIEILIDVSDKIVQGGYGERREVITRCLL